MSLKPQNINERSWYYEEKTHLLLVHEWRTPDGDWIRTDQIKIPWKKIEASLKRVKDAEIASLREARRLTLTEQRGTHAGEL